MREALHLRLAFLAEEKERTPAGIFVPNGRAAVITGAALARCLPGIGPGAAGGEEEEGAHGFASLTEAHAFLKRHVLEPLANVTRSSNLPIV